MMQPAVKRDPYSSLRNGEFRRYILGRFFYTVSIQMQAVVVGWLIYDLTHDPLSLGLIGLAEAVPALSVALYAGHVADRFNRKKIIIAGLLVLILCSLILMGFASVAHFRIEFPVPVVHGIYAIIFLSGIARGFLFPALFAFWSQLIPRNLYANASIWNSTVWQSGAIVGPAAGGIAYGFLGSSGAFAIDAAILFSGALMIATIPEKPLAFAGKHEDILKSLTAGIGFVFRNQMILGAISLDLFAVLFGGATALLPVFAAEILLVGPEGLGLLRAAPSIGAFVMALFMIIRPPGVNAGRNLLFSVLGYGVSMIVFALSTNFYLSLFALALSGAFDNVSVVIRSTIIQLLTPEEMRGRVASVNTMFIGSSNEIGAFESGVAARVLGTVPSVIFGGVMTLIVVVTTTIIAPKLRRLNIHRLSEARD